MNNTWFVIVNPKSGNKNFKRNLKIIQQELNNNHIPFIHRITKHHKHEIELVNEAVIKGYTNIISVGGDGTLHHVVNGVMLQKVINTKHITIAVIPQGTGNDWIKTYNIPNNIKDAIALIKKQNTIYQDIGYLELENTSSYFNNVAGIGYDGYVVNKLNKLKKFGGIAYLLSGISGLLFYKKTPFKVLINNTIIEDKCLMTLFGICKYSAGGMQLTDFKKSNNGLFDITFAKNLTLVDLILNIKKLYNGKIIGLKKVATYTTNKITVIPTNVNRKVFIQADGELIGTGTVNVSLIKKALKFVIN